MYNLLYITYYVLFCEYGSTPITGRPEIEAPNFMIRYPDRFDIRSTKNPAFKAGNRGTTVNSVTCIINAKYDCRDRDSIPTFFSYNF